MDQALIARYQSGGDIYASLQTTYGTTAADTIATAALSGDETQINAALVQVKFGAPLETSTSTILADQLLTDPLAAPLESAEKVASNSIVDFLKSPAVMLILGIALFLYLGGIGYLTRKLAAR